MKYMFKKIVLENKLHNIIYDLDVKSTYSFYKSIKLK